MQKSNYLSQMMFGHTMNQESTLFLPSVADTHLQFLDLRLLSTLYSTETKFRSKSLGRGHTLEPCGDNGIYCLKSRGKINANPWEHSGFPLEK